jgi:hypothetical protein
MFAQAIFHHVMLKIIFHGRILASAGIPALSVDRAPDGDSDRERETCLVRFADIFRVPF